MNKALLFVGAGALVLMGGYFLLSGRGETPKTDLGNKVARETKTVSYQCVDEQSIAAAFNQGFVVLSLLDGRQVVLQQTEAASGAKYVNREGTLIFWTKDNEAFFQEFGKTTYADCVAQPGQ